MRILKADELLARTRAVAPSEQEVARIGEGDAVIVCAGFEERAVVLLQRAVSEGAQSFAVVVVAYYPATEDNLKRLEEIKRLCAGCARVQVWTYNRRDPAGAGCALLDLAGERKVHIDISGMSRLLIVQLVAEATRRRILHRTTIWYAEARDYFPREQDVARASTSDDGDALGAAMFLSSGVFGLLVVPELSSVAMQGQPMIVVAFPSWNTMQLAAVRAELQASRYVFVRSVSLDPAESWRCNAVMALNHLENIDERDLACASTLDYRDTLSALLTVYRDHAQREKLVVAPTGTKMQTVAVGIACGWLPDIQIVYPSPIEFSPPAEYTQGFRSLFHASLGELEMPPLAE
jgi:hypothetical protein